MRMVAPLGSLSPLYASGGGEALLAALEQEERAELMDQLNFDAMTQKRLGSRASLSEEIDRIIAEGRLYDREEHVDGMQCVAAPGFGEHVAPMCALSISGSSVRVTESVLVGHGDAAWKTAQMATQLLSGAVPKHWSSDA